MPYWWVHTYDLLLKNEDCNSFLEKGSLILPGLTTVELDALSIILNQCQYQMLAGKSPITLSQNFHNKHSTSQKKSDIFAFSRMLQMFSGIRLKVKQNDRHTAINLFHKEVWQEDFDEQTVNLEPTDLGSMLILGYGDPYLCQASIQSKEAIKHLLTSVTPLSIWRTPWLDFKSHEKSVLIQLEKTMQWTFSYLSLNGVFEGNLKEFLLGAMYSQSKAKKNKTDFLENGLINLGKIGKKLSDHGYLEFDWDNEFLAFDKTKNGMSLVWKVIDSRAELEDQQSYLKKCSYYFFESLYIKHISRIFSEVLRFNPNRNAVTKEVKNTVDALIDLDEPNKTEPLILFNGNLPVCLGALFIEWLIRLKDPNSIRLPDSLLTSEIIKPISEANKENIHEKFTSFCDQIKDQTGLMEDLKKIPGYSLAQPDLDLKKFSSKKIKTSNPSSSSKKELSIQKSPEVDIKPDIKPVSLPAKDLLYQKKLKQKALDKLVFLRKKDRFSYNLLKKEYLNSLNENHANIVLEMQKILTPELFDNQIKHSLVRYMVVDPDRWELNREVVLERDSILKTLC